jgi:peroxin-10
MDLQLDEVREQASLGNSHANQLPAFLAIQTLGEEYTDIWYNSSYTGAVPPPPPLRAALLFLSLVPSYVLGRWGQSASLQHRHPEAAKWMRRLPAVFETASEVNLAIFYMRGTYYGLVKRLMGVKYVSYADIHHPSVLIVL